MIDHEKLKETRAGSRRGGQGWKPREGENKIRVLPPRLFYLQNPNEIENLAIQYKLHYFAIEGRPTDVSRCLEELKQRCPACATWRMHRRSEDPGLAELARQVSPADSYLLNILDINNLQAGMQRWGANWTCWDKIMEIAANPAWGDVIDPANGVNFFVNMTPKGKSRSGYNSYSVVPDSTRTTVMKILDGIPDWQASLDKLEDQIAEAKTDDEIVGLLNEMGFPTVSGVGAARTVAAPAAATPVAAVQPPAAGPTIVPAPGTTAPTEVQPVVTTSAPPADAVPQPQPVAAIGAPTTTPTAAPSVHYDPGPDYTPKMPDEERPPGAPRCYGDYDPGRHQCPTCPVITECQLQILGVSPTEGDK